MSSRHHQALSHLLPEGHAWPRDAATVWMRVLGGLAEALAEHDAFAAQTVAEWQPHSTHTRLAEWEEATGLPDACYGTAQDATTRQQAVLVRLRGAHRAYEDSSPAAPEALEAVCAGLGAVVDVRVNHPFRVGDRVGQRLGRNGVMHVILQGSHTPDAAAQLLMRIGCALERMVPARFALVLSQA